MISTPLLPLSRSGLTITGHRHCGQERGTERPIPSINRLDFCLEHEIP